MSSSPRLNLLLGVGFLSAGMLGFEMLAIRWISILYYPLAAYIVIALALLGLGASGGLLALRGDRPAGGLRHASFAAAAFSAAAIVALALAWTAADSAWTALGLTIGLSLPFFFAGLALSILFAARPTRVAQVYFADLLGGGLGAIVAMVALGGIDGVHLAGLLAAFGATSAALLAEARGPRIGFSAAAATLALLAFAGPAPFGITPAAPKELAQALQLDGAPRWEWSHWNPLARIDVVSLEGDVLEPDLPLAYKLVTQDGGAPTLLLQPDRASSLPSRASHPEEGTPEGQPAGDPSIRLGAHTVFGIPFWLRPEAKALIIGLGGGPDLLAALEYAPERVDVVEVNPATIALLQDRYAEFTGDPLSSPVVKVTEGDGRFFVARSDDAYDVIQLTGVDTAVASAAGSPNLAENYLYTREAFRLYYDHLSHDGLLAVSFPNVEGMGLRLVNLVTQTLADAGIERPQDHIIVSEITGYVHVLMKRSPFTEAELDILEEGFQSRVSSVYFPLYHRLFGDPPQAFVERSAIIASPRIEWPGVYGGYLEARRVDQGDAFLGAQPQTVAAPSDDRPFVFVLDKWGGRAPSLNTLTGLLMALTVAGVLLLIGPPAVLRRRGLSVPGRLPLGLFFLAIGLGYILLEVSLIQKLSLLLGHPSLALVTTISGLLVASAIGSLSSGRWRGRPEVLILVAGAAIAALAVVMTPLLAFVTDRLLGQPLAVRVLAALVLLAVPGFFMGMPFPTGLGHVKALVPAFVPWAWGLNATASVSATILGLLIALLWGLQAVFLTAAGLYVVAVLTFAVAASRRASPAQSYR